MGNFNHHFEKEHKVRLLVEQDQRYGQVIPRGAVGEVEDVDGGTILVQFYQEGTNEYIGSQWVAPHTIELLTEINFDNMRNYIQLEDGTRIPLSQETVEELKKRGEWELDTYAKCWNTVMGSKNESYYIDSVDQILQSDCSHYTEDYANHLPTRYHAKKVQVYIKLLVIAEAYNDGWEHLRDGDDEFFTISMTPHGEMVILKTEVDTGDIKFKDRETVKKAFDNFYDLWAEYFLWAEYLDR